jgi:hypothetical protein
MAKVNSKANDPREEKKEKVLGAALPLEGDSKVVDKTKTITEEKKSDKTEEVTNDSEDISQEVKEEIDYGTYEILELLAELGKSCKAENWNSQNKKIQEIIHQFELKFKTELQNKKEEFVKEGGKEIDFYYRPKHKVDFDVIVKEYKQNKRKFFQEREQSQKVNLDRKLEIIESLKELINVDENINTTYKRFKELQESWHKTGLVPRAKSNNLRQTYKHHTEIFYDFLHLNRELRELDFKHNYQEKIKIIEEAESLSKIGDVLKASRDLNTLHRLWKNDLGPVGKEHGDELWKRFQEASHIIHSRRQEFDKEYDNILEDNLKKKKAILEKMEGIRDNLPKNHNEWHNTINLFNKIRQEFQDIGQVPKADSKASWNKFRTVSREINHQKNIFYKTQKAEQKNNIDLKKNLIKEVKDILEKENWKDFNDRMKSIQKDWREIGFVPRKFSNVLWEEFKAICNLYFDRIKSGYQKINEAEAAKYNEKNEFIKNIKKLSLPTEIEAVKIFYSEHLKQFEGLGVLSESADKKLLVDLSEVFASLIEKSKLEESDREESKTYVKLLLIENNEDELNQEIQNIRKKTDEINAEIRQLENNLEFFSNTSSENPLFKEVSTEIANLKSRSEFWENRLISTRQIKRKLKAKPDEEATKENQSEGTE